jgi:hypothetical protein
MLQFSAPIVSQRAQTTNSGSTSLRAAQAARI